MKKFITILLILTIVISALILTGCSEKGDNTEKITVTFLDWDGTIIQICEIVSGKKPQMPQNLTRADDETESFSFVGWDDESTAEVELLTELEDVSGNMTLKAVYKSSKIYFVHFIVDGEEYLKYKAGDVFTPPVPEKEGYKFIAWCKEETLNTKKEVHYTFFRYITEDEYLYAKFQTN